ncbi:MAG TPA: PLDc N-terminal domain-containing protein, partial [Verrucomicrobiae bacterium]|nr:PLDc N-terminal domain-containing protein [Verrucomicrobiae bacterium]
MDWLDYLSRFWPYLAAGFDFLAALLASIHAILNKRDSRAAVLWLGFIWLLPMMGPVLYLALGVNRIRRQALSLRVGGATPSEASRKSIPNDMGEPHRPEAKHLRMLSQVVDRVAIRPLTRGNRIQVLVNGDEAYPAMLEAIESAKVSLSLETYIFDNDRTGGQFVEALSRAVKRGVQVRVLIDDAGARYSFPSIVGKL